MAEKVTKWIKDWKVTVTLCYRNRLNRFMLLPPRVGKVLRANSQALALAKGSKSIRSRTALGDTDSVTKKERKRKDLPDILFSLVLNASLQSYQNPPINGYVAKSTIPWCKFTHEIMIFKVLDTTRRILCLPGISSNWKFHVIHCIRKHFTQQLKHEMCIHWSSIFQQDIIQTRLCLAECKTFNPVNHPPFLITISSLSVS